MGVLRQCQRGRQHGAEAGPHRRYRHAPIFPGEDPVIGCLFVRDVRFFPDDATVTPPPPFAPNIVQGKSYDLAHPLAARYFSDLVHLILGVNVELDFSQPWHRPGPVFGDPRLAPYRLGQRMREWLPEDDLVYVVLDAVATLDLGEFRRRYRAYGHGRAAFES